MSDPENILEILAFVRIVPFSPSFCRDLDDVSSGQLEYPTLGWRAGRAASRPHRGHSILPLLLLLLLLLLFPFSPSSSSFSSPPLPPPLLCSLLRVAATVPERPRPAPEAKERREEQQQQMGK